MIFGPATDFTMAPDGGLAGGQTVRCASPS